jgi:hypothetical protein
MNWIISTDDFKYYPKKRSIMKHVISLIYARYWLHQGYYNAGLDIRIPRVRQNSTNEKNVPYRKLNVLCS